MGSTSTLAERRGWHCLAYALGEMDFWLRVPMNADFSRSFRGIQGDMIGPRFDKGSHDEH